MSKDTRLTILAVNVEADAFAALLDGGFIDILDGARPKDANGAITTQKVGVTLALGKPAFAKSADGVISANPINAGVAVNDIKATWARAYRSDHKTPVMDVSVGTKETNIILPTTNIAAGVTVSCSSFTHIVAKITVGF